MCSCVDTIILPYDKTVDEDFWKSKSDVSLMVNGAYKQMLNSDLIFRLFVWGDLRSDEMTAASIGTTNTTITGMSEIESANIQITNIFADWATLYSVINYCNIVLEKAPGVMEVDPSYTQGDYDVDRAQMLTLRSLCYFYLVRAFRDVPYSEEAFMSSSQNLDIGQTDPSTVLANCIRDLEEAEPLALAPNAYSDWRRTGWINRDAVRSLLADIYLWRASVNHDLSDYQRCVDYCNLVIASKEAQHSETMDDELKGTDYSHVLAAGDEAFNWLFYTNYSARQDNADAEECIFVLQFDGNYNSNTGLCMALNRYANNAASSYMLASSIFGTLGSNYVYEKTGDFRYLENVYDVGTEASGYKVRKMVAANSTRTPNPVGASAYPSAAENRAYNNYTQNYIVYRLTDVMLMKAEAMVQLAADDSDIQLEQAFNIVREVNSRSLYTGSMANDSLHWVQNNTKTQMETLVLKERLRELCFEGKRWYDLLRYNYRQMEGVDYTTTLAQQNEEGRAFVSNSKSMLDLLVRKYSSGGSAVAAKMSTEPYLYMPVLEGQMKVNPNLKQNPVYSSANQYEKD